MKKTLLVSLLVLFAGVKISMADYRYYAWTYQFMTMLPGKSELEIYNQFSQSDLGNDNSVSWKRQYEIETGLTENWDFSFYMVDSYKPVDAKTKFNELKFRTRFKLAQKGSFVVDPIFYVEYKVQADRAYPDKWETKLILAKDINKLNVALNIIPEESYYSGTKNKYWKTEYSFGASYPVYSEVSRLGFELNGDLTNNKHSLGPVISFKGKKIWAAVSPLFGLNDGADNIKVQAIIGIFL